MENNAPLPRRFFARSAEIVARELLGNYLIREEEGKCLIVKIVETEGYLGPQDLAAHSRFGETQRNRVMFGPPGFAYVYLIYGMYYCLNVVTEKEGIGAAVLLRAAEPVKNVAEKTSGPGLLCKALHINKSLYGTDMAKFGPLYFVLGKNVPEEQIAAAPRVGAAYAGIWAEEKLRFYLKNNPFVSRR